MEPESSLPYSQAPATCPNSIQSPQPLLTSSRSILILSSHLCLGLPNGLFPSRFPHQNLVHASPFLHTCHMPRPSHCSRFYQKGILYHGKLWVYIIIFTTLLVSSLHCILILICHCRLRNEKRPFVSLHWRSINVIGHGCIDFPKIY